MTLTDLLNQVPDPALRAKLADAIGKSGGNLAYTVATEIPTGSDLAKFTYIAGQQYIAAPGAAYTLTPTFALNVANVSIDLTGATITIPPVAGAGTGIELRGNAISLVGWHVVSAPSTMTLVRVYGTDCHADITTDVRVGICIKVDPSADRTTGRFVSAVPTGGQGAYVVGAWDVTFDGCQSVGSLGEDDIRFSADDPPEKGGTGKIPKHGRVLRSVLLGCKQVGSKQSASISFRNMGTGAADDWCEISDCTLGEWARMGQDSKTPTVFGLKFNRNHMLPEPHGITQLTLVAATMSECDSNTFDCPPAQRAIGGTFGVSKCDPQKLTNNIIRTVPTGAARKKLFIWNNGSGENDGTGTKVQ